MTARYFERAQRWLAQRDSLPPKWREQTGPSDALLFVTAEELADVQHALERVFDRFRPRQADPALRPEGSRAVNLIQIAITLDDEEKQ